MHVGDAGDLEVRALLPGAGMVEIIDLTREPSVSSAVPPLGSEGLFELLIGQREPFPYRLRVEWKDGLSSEWHDPYSFEPTLEESDLAPFGRGEDPLAYQKLGAHPKVINDVPGFAFAVWAPQANSVSLIGECNGWNDLRHRMRRLGDSGVWELFVPELASIAQYKYRVFSEEGFQDKADPFAAFSEGPPGNASLTYAFDQYEWGDAAWMESRRKLDYRVLPMSVYEMHLGSWRRKKDGSYLSYLELAEELPRYVKELGFTHVEFLPLSEHPLPASWGYQVSGYFSPTSRFGKPEDLMHLVDALHLAGIGVLMDWVPAHFPRDDFALARFDGRPTYEYADPRMGEHQDWGTLVFDYARPEVRSFLMSSALAWLDRFHVDGLRVDAVASMIYLDYSRKEGEWLPNRFGGRENLDAISLLQRTNEEIHRLHPGAIVIAEESTAYPKVTGKVSEKGLGFDFKWNMGWMNDVLEYFNAPPVERAKLAEKLTFGHSYQFSENFVQVFSHDEVVHGKSPMIFKMNMGGEGAVSEQAALLRALYVYMWAWPGKKTLFMGNEFGQTAEWDFDNALDWGLLEHDDHRGLSGLLRDLNQIYCENQFLGVGDSRSDKFRWIECGDRLPAVFSFLRFGDSSKDTLLVVCNFSGEVVSDHRVGVSFPGTWRVVVHSQDKAYGGLLEDVSFDARAESVPEGEWEHSLTFALPSPSVVLLMPQDG